MSCAFFPPGLSRLSALSRAVCRRILLSASFPVSPCAIHPVFPSRPSSCASFTRLGRSVRFVSRSVLRSLPCNPTPVVSPFSLALLTRTSDALTFVNHFRRVLCYSATSLLLFGGLIIRLPSIEFCITLIPITCLEVSLNWEISNFKIMAEYQEKLKKLFIVRSNLKSELRNIHKDITDAIDWQDRRVKVKRLVSKLKDAFFRMIQEKSGTLLLGQWNRESRFNLSHPWAMVELCNQEQWWVLLSD